MKLSFSNAVGLWAVVAWTGAAICTPLATAQPLTTALTYQGSLSDGGVPASGTFDLRFKLFDQLAPGGTQIGATLCVDDIAVVDGRFTTLLDFGAAFAGQRRFLEVEVRAGSVGTCGVAGGYTILTPRQELTAAPNAAYSLTAGTATNASSLNGQPASFYTNASNITAGTISDLRLSSNISTNTGAQTFSGLKTFTTAPSFTGTTPFSVGGTGLVFNLNADLLDGLSSNAYARASHTHDGADIASGILSDLRLSSNIPRLASVNAFTAVNTFSSSVGLGTTSPTAKLHIEDSTNLPLVLNTASIAPFKVTNGSSSGILMDSNQIESVGGPLYLNYRGDGNGRDVSMVVGGGDVGIGTDSPIGRLEIVVGSAQSFQFRQDGFIPGINVNSFGGSAGIMRLRNTMEVWPSDDATRAGKIDVRNTSGNATITLDGATGNATYTNQPAAKGTQTIRGNPSLTNATIDLDTLSVDVPGAGVLVIVATVGTSIVDPPGDTNRTTASFTLRETTGGGGVQLISQSANAYSDQNAFQVGNRSVITLNYTITSNGAGTRTFVTSLAASQGTVNYGSSTFTIMYYPRGM